MKKFFSTNRGSLITLLLLVLLPFVVGLFDGASPATVWVNGSGQSKFIQGLAIEIFILAIYALSFDLIFGITGMLSFGHSMFFAVGAYLTGIAIKNFGLTLLPYWPLAWQYCCRRSTKLSRAQRITFFLTFLYNFFMEYLRLLPPGCSISNRGRRSFSESQQK